MQIPEHIFKAGKGQFCIQCFSGPVERVYRENRTYYSCAACKAISERSLVLDDATKWWVDEHGTYWHESVGIFVRNKENKLLFFERNIFPFALAIPAGHLDKGEESGFAAKRELQEETGISGMDLLLFSEEDIRGDQCRRGADDHHWHLYVTQIPASISAIVMSDEGTQPVWLTLQEAVKKDLVYPVRYLIEKYGDALLTD